MIRYLLVFILLKSILFGCSLCSIYTPKTHIVTQIKADKTHIKTLNITWTFADEFSKELLKLYDINLDKTFDEKELAIIQSYLIDYLKDKNFLTTISYDKQINEKSNDFTVKNYKMNFKNSVLSFEYNIDLNYKIYDKNILNIRVFDNQGFFFILFDPKKQLIHIPYKIKEQINLNDVSFTIDAPTQGLQEEKIQDEVIKEDIEKNENKEVISTQTLSNISQEQSILEKYTQNIKKYLLYVQNGEDKFALLFLLMASFIYGVIHSIGPGHGKALAFSYFTSQKSSYFQAFIISLAIAFVHIIGAFVLVMISVFILQSVMNRFLEDSISYITIFCALVIMLLAVYIFYKKLTKKSCSCCSVDLQKINFSVKAQNINFVKTSTNKPLIIEKRDKKQDLIFVITAGIIPCPGTVLLFVYAFLLKTYFAVILASISISLGMAVVIFASSFLGVSLNKATSKSKKLLAILEIISVIFMFILALLLFLSSLKFS